MKGVSSMVTTVVVTKLFFYVALDL